MLKKIRIWWLETHLIGCRQSIGEVCKHILQFRREMEILKQKEAEIEARLQVARNG